MTHSPSFEEVSLAVAENSGSPSLDISSGTPKPVNSVSSD